MVKIQLKVVWFPSKSDVLPIGAVIRVWTNDDGTGESQEFAVGRRGMIKGQLRVPEHLDTKQGELLCRIRGFLRDEQIAAAREPIKWRDGVASDPLYLGHLVQGRVSDKAASAGKLPAASRRRVEVYGAGKRDQRSPSRGRSEAIGEDGRYWVKYQPFHDEETSPAIELRYGYDRARGTSLASRVISKPRVEEEADLAVGGEGAARPDPDKPPQKPPFIVCGALAYVSRERLGDVLELRVLQERLSGRYVIHSETVAAGERYEVAFAVPDRKGALTVEAHLPATQRHRTTLLSVSRSIPRPSTPLELDLLVGDPAATLPLFEATMARIAPYTDGLALTALDAAQWGTLAAAAGLSDADRNRIRHAVALTREVADRLGAPDAARYLPVFFVLAPGTPTLTLAQLVAETDALQLARLNKAQKSDEIGPEPWRFTDADKAYSVVLADFFALKNGALGEHVLFEPSGDNDHIHAQLAAIGVAAADRRRHVMALAEDAADIPGRFETSIEDSQVLTPAEKQRVLTVHATAALADSQAPLVNALASPSAKYPLTHPAAVAAYKRDELARVIKATGAVPAAYQQEPDPAQAFADAILDRCFAQFPTAAFLSRLNVEPALPETARHAAETLAAHPGFDLFSVPVAHHFQSADVIGQKSRQDSRGAADRVVLAAPQYEALQTVQRLARLAPRASAAAATVGLTSMGIGSAHDIVAMGRLRFTQAAAQRMDSTTADRVYAGAAWIDRLTSLTAYVAHQADSFYTLDPLNPFALQTDTTPALSDLFGSFDYCACRHCRSVYSPAAYLTDLLHWLQREFTYATTTGTGLRTSTGTVSGYDKLIERRADIAQIKLNCENTDTLLPHIDLVVETLEYSVSQATLDLSGVHNQTDWPTPDLLRDGEHFGSTEKPAYQAGRLLDAVYPWTLPFNLSLEQSRAYLKAMGVDRSALVALANGARPWDVDPLVAPPVAAETLGLNELQFKIIAGQHVAAWTAYWNNIDVATENVAGILRLSGLSYEALLDVLKTEYVRHAGTAPVIFTIVFDPDKPCDLSAATVSPALSQPYAQRIHRMTRLQRALGWTYWELDEAIIAIGDDAQADPLSQVFLIRLGHFEVLRRRTKLPVHELLAWFGGLPAYQGQGPSEFYKAEFLSKIGPGQDAALFKLAVAADLAGRELDIAWPLGGNQAPVSLNALSPQQIVQLRETLGYGQGDFEAVIAWLGLTDLNLGWLTPLYGVHSLARAASLSIDELIAFCAFSPAQPIEWETPADALRFFDRLDWLRAEDITPAAFTYLLSNDDNGDGLALQPDDLDRLKARLYGADGEFHALLSDPPLAATPPEHDVGRLERLFARVLGGIQPPANSALLDAVVRGVTDPLLNPEVFVNLVFPDQASDHSLAFDIALAVSHPSYPRAADDSAATDPMLKSEIEVKAAILQHLAPSRLRRDLWDATLLAYSDFLQLPPDKTAFLLDHAHADVLAPGAFAAALTPQPDLGYHPPPAIAPPPGYDDMIAQLHLAAARLRRLGMTEASLGDLQSYWTDRNPGVAANADDAKWLDPFRVGPTTSSPGVAAGQWRNLTEGLGLRPVLGISLAALVNQLHLGTTPDPVAQARTLMLAAGSSLARHGADRINAVLGHLNTLGAGTSVAGLIAKAAQIFADLDRWGLTFDQAIRFAAYPVPGVPLLLPDEIRLSLRNRFADEAKWDKVIRKAHDPLRQIRRDRLADYLIATRGLENADDLYAHFLIDVEMSSCMKTSRLVLATNAVQLFVQRIFLGLEPGIRFADAEKEEWKWRKNYRVWEAARKVFLYPENWLAASLRLDKTRFFEALEEELMQGELSDERIETAYVEYLKKVAEVSRLEIAGLCFDAGAGSPSRPDGELHVFGRTRAQPHRYFHRLQKTNGAWTPWSPIEREIEGDHLIPVLWNRRLHILWPTFIERRNGPADYYEIHFNDISLQSGKWSPKRKLPGKVLSGQYSGVGVFNDLDRKTGNFGPGPLWYEHPLTLGEPIGAYDFAEASLKRPSYFFRASPHPANAADLRVNVRREFDETWDTWHDGYLEAAYEDGLRYSGGDPGATLEPAYNPRALADVVWPGKYWSGRPHYTLTKAMKLRNGFETVEQAEQAFPAPHKLYSKVAPSVWTQTSRTLFDSTPTDYELVFAQQNDHHLFEAPFFFEDNSHTYFADRSFRSPVSAGTGIRGSGQQARAVTTMAPAYRFTNFTVPGVSLYLAELNAKGIDGLLAPTAALPAQAHFGLRRQERVFDAQFAARYQPTDHVHPGYPVETMDFTHGSPTASYFWEIFFHIPMLVAERLRAEGKFERALKWVGYIFDPTNQDDAPDPRRFWMLKPFHDYQAFGQIQTQMLLLSTASTPQDQARRQALIRQIEAWEQDPFDPHGVAAMRTLGYMLWTFKTYVGILIDWGDSLFRQDSRESINEATQLYVFAGELLGRRPQEVEKADAAPKTYAEIRTLLDAFSNTAVEVENNLAVYDIVPDAGAPSGAIASSWTQALYFCIPHNPQLLQLWDTVGDRLFKIRHCMNIEGTVRELALFQPPIDPGLLVRARAAGLDISEVLADLAKPRPPYRFTYLLAKASEFAAEVKAFGGALLAAAQNRDGEQMSQLRSQHEIALQKTMRNVRQRQIDEAKAQIGALTQSRQATEVRKAAYQSRQRFIDAENRQIELLDQSQDFATAQAVMSGIASIMHFFDLHIGTPPYKPLRLGDIVQALANAAGAYAGARSLSSTKAGFTAGAARRQEEWDLQIMLAAEEVKQIDKQIVAAEIRSAIAEQELANLDLQIEQSTDVLDFMKSKFTNQMLYSWIAIRLAGLHYQAYKLAYDLAKKAQAAYALELGRPDDSFVAFGHWDGQKQGMLAGESLSLQLRQLDAAYIEHNTREYELRRNVSLRLLDPGALATLIQDGACEFELPEWLFDLDCPGLYMRRIKTLALTLPCVTGPQIPVHAKLTLLRHEIRWNPNMQETRDVRFDAIQSVITSAGLNDNGLFETNLQDPRYLPFEGCGVVARFRLELPGELQFDPTTLADAILAVSYTAREGGDVFRIAAQAAMPANTAPPLMMSFRHDFADDWRAFLAAGTAAAGNVQSVPAPFAMTTPAIPFDRQPYRARSTTGNYAYADRAWALTADDAGQFGLVDVAPTDVPLEGASPWPPTLPTMFFGAAGLQWKKGPTAPPRKVADLFLVYEKP